MRSQAADPDKARGGIGQAICWVQEESGRKIAY